MSLRDIVTDSTLIYVDGNQDYASLAKQDGRFHVCKLGWHTGATPRSCDVAWWQDGKLFAMEEKKPGDFDSSLRARRLQRELRGIVDVVDIPILGLRTRLDDYLGVGYYWIDEDWTLLEASKWTLHGLTVFLPPHKNDMLGYLVRLRDALTSAGARSILAGTDQKRHVGGSPFQQRVRRLLDGVGPVAAQKLDDYFQGNFMLAINARPAMWRAAGAHKGIVKQVEELHDSQL